MLKSLRINELNKKIHSLVRKQDVSAWKFSPELHSLLAQRENLIDQLLLQGAASAGFIRTISDFETLTPPTGGGRKEQ